MEWIDFIENTKIKAELGLLPKPHPFDYIGASLLDYDKDRIVSKEKFKLNELWYYVIDSSEDI